MVRCALMVKLYAKPGKENEVESFLKSALDLVEEEPATSVWFALKTGPAEFAIFDAFPDESGRKAHLAGKVAAKLMAQASDLFTAAPQIQEAEVLADKLPFEGRKSNELPPEAFAP
ncbi:putative quinol monooxygenase [Bdellovibrio sp. NC01]|uniref:putative quinol monooxygenase n=1 Tax=Bdellovibrio sp. NC01 TaxID=2220073 RepID=UPI001158B620|nr:antibiotic biosynthesis monooxygenase [Bdellovibrio sp. NC01]